MKVAFFSLFLISFCILALSKPYEANQAEQLRRLMNSDVAPLSLEYYPWVNLDLSKHNFSPVYMSPQDGQMEKDRISALPGQPKDTDFAQYSGYVTVDQKNERALFYYFVESPQNSSTKPLVLWLNGGPGCSSLGYGAMEELGPFRVNSDGKTLSRNNFAWSTVANILFLELPAGVGFSYNTTDKFVPGDMQTAEDSYTFLINWLERFPQYKTHDFFITGESYAGHYVPQLASLILNRNKSTNQTVINLRGIAIGNAYVDTLIFREGMFEFLWSHALISDEGYDKIRKNCNFSAPTRECNNAVDEVDTGNIDYYSIYAPTCRSDNSMKMSDKVFGDFDPCSNDYVSSYMNDPAVQKALHATKTNWQLCSYLDWSDRPETVLPIIKQLTTTGLSVWLYSGDTDSIVSVTSTRHAIRNLGLLLNNSWRPWYSNHEVGGYVAEYKGLVMVTVRGAGHMVPSDQPERALTMISSFLQGKLPPAV